MTAPFMRSCKILYTCIHVSRVSSLYLGLILALLLDLKLSASLLDGLAQEGDYFGGIFSAKDGAASDNDIGTGLGGLINGAGSETAVDFNVELGIPLSQGLDLGEL